MITIGEKAFSGTGIRSIILGSNVKEIKTAAFYSCNNLTAAVFNEGLEIIGARAFEGCPIASVSLPATVKELGEYSFSCISGYYGSEHRQSLRIHPANPYIKTDGEALYVMSGSEKTLQVMYSQKYRQYVYDHHMPFPTSTPMGTQKSVPCHRKKTTKTLSPCVDKVFVVKLLELYRQQLIFNNKFLVFFCVA